MRRLTITSTTICSALAGMIAYFIIGSIVNYKVKGARGLEVIPNIHFWKELPFLIKVYYNTHTSISVHCVLGHLI